MDNKLRLIERELAQSPGDEGLKERWILEKAKIGETMITTQYKISYDGKFYSETSYLHPWTKKGTKFDSKHKAIEALDKALTNTGGYRRNKSNTVKKADMAEIKLIEIITYTVEQDIGVDFLEEKTKAELIDIRKQKEELAKQEEKLMKQVQNKRKALLQKEKKLAKKIGK